MKYLVALAIAAISFAGMAADTGSPCCKQCTCKECKCTSCECSKGKTCTCCKKDCCKNSNNCKDKCK